MRKSRLLKSLLSAAVVFALVLGGTGLSQVADISLPELFSVKVNALTNEEIAAQYPTPAGYSDNDYQKLVRFALQGDNLSKLEWDLSEPGNWVGIVWSEDAVQSVEGIYFYDGKGDLVTGLSGNFDVSDFKALVNLLFVSQELTSLDVSGNTALKIFECSVDQLTSLDVSENTALTTLYCGGNQLTSLDVSKNTELTDLSCDNNQLTSISSLDKLTKLQYVNVSYNNLDLNSDSVKASIAKISALPGISFVYEPQGTFVDPTKPIVKDVTPADNDDKAGTIISDLADDGKIKLSGNFDSDFGIILGSSGQAITVTDLIVNYSKYDKYLFDLQITKNDGDVNVTLNIPANLKGFGNYVVFHYNSGANKWDKLNTTHDGDKTVMFTADSFSPFAIVGYNNASGGGGNYVSGGGTADNDNTTETSSSSSSTPTEPATAVPASPSNPAPDLPSPPALPTPANPDPAGNTPDVVLPNGNNGNGNVNIGNGGKGDSGANANNADSGSNNTGNGGGKDKPAPVNTGLGDNFVLPVVVALAFGMLLVCFVVKPRRCFALVVNNPVILKLREEMSKID